MLDKKSISPSFLAPISITRTLESYLVSNILSNIPISLLKFLIVDEEDSITWDKICVVEVLPLLPVIPIFIPLKFSARFCDVFNKNLYVSLT